MTNALRVMAWNAGGALGFYRLSFAADKRYSLARGGTTSSILPMTKRAHVNTEAAFKET